MSPGTVYAPGAVMSPQARGVKAIEEILSSPPFHAGTREHVEFVKGLVLGAGRALAACRPKVPPPRYGAA